jgi:hypothetical protein
MEVNKMEELRDSRQHTLVVRDNQMVFVIPSQVEGVEEVVYIDSEQPVQNEGEPINLGGALANLVDGDAMLEALDRIGRESPPTPPIACIGC